MDYLTSPDHENARRVMSALEGLDVELNVSEQGPAVSAFFMHGELGKTKSSYGVVVGTDGTDVVLAVDNISTLKDLALEKKITFLNEYNNLLSDDFVCSGTLFCDDGGSAQLRYYIDSNDHALQERMDECVRRISVYIPDIVRVANGNARMDILELEGEKPFAEPAVLSALSDASPSESSSATESQSQETDKKKGGLFGRLFSK